ncbi:MAG: FAD-binding oxidoreductase [Eubacteriales bacterium]
MLENKSLQEKLRACLDDPSGVVFGAEIKPEYGHDELSGVRRMPEALVTPLSTCEVSAVLRFAYEHDIPVTPRGAGTGLVGGAVPVLGGIVLDLSGMKRILELDPDNLTVTVEPGVLLLELNAYVTEHGFLYPPDPGEKTATIGGNIATNAGGMRAVRYGVTRDYVRGLEVVLPDGRVIEVGGKVVKNSSGYALKDLFVGSEGTLGVITRATLRLVPLPRHSISLLVPFPTLEQAIDTVPAIIRSQASPTAVEFMQREVMAAAEDYLGAKFPAIDADAFLLLKFDGNARADIERDYEPVAELCLAHGAYDVFIMDTAERNNTIWKARGAFLEAIKGSTTEMDEVDVVVPRDRVNEMVRFTRELQESAGVRIRFFGHAGDGNLHIYILRDELDEQTWAQRCRAAMDSLYRKAGELQGQVSGEHGIGFVKRDYLQASLPADTLALMQGIKAAFDPKHLLNPGKICCREAALWGGAEGIASGGCPIGGN